MIAASPWSARRILALLHLSQTSYYRRKKQAVWQHGGGRPRLESDVVTAILDTARRHTDYGYRSVASALKWEHPTVKVSPISVYRVLRHHGLLGPRTTLTPAKKRPWIRFERPHPQDLWQVDVSYWYLQGWGFYYLHTLLDDHSRFIVISQLYRTFGAEDGVRMLEQALAAVPAADRAHVELLADHGVTYTAEVFRQACERTNVRLIFASVQHPQTKGKIERWHRTIREAIEERVRHAATPEEAQRIIDAYVQHYNYVRPHTACQGYPPIWRYRPTEAREWLEELSSTKYQAFEAGTP